jgi:hypothetical protein
MPANLALARGAGVVGMLHGQCSFVSRASAVRATRILLLPLASPTMVVSGMAHSTAAPAKGEKRECADTKYQPDPIAA